MIWRVMLAGGLYDIFAPDFILLSFVTISTSLRAPESQNIICHSCTLVILRSKKSSTVSQTRRTQWHRTCVCVCVCARVCTCPLRGNTRREGPKGQENIKLLSYWGGKESKSGRGMETWERGSDIPLWTVFFFTTLYPPQSSLFSVGWEK